MTKSYEMMTCVELRQKIKDFNENGKNWHRKVSGYSKLNKCELITLCEKCDKVKEIKRERQIISYKDLLEWVCDDDKTTYNKRWSGNDEDDFIEIEYEWNIFAECRPTESSIIFIIPYGENDEKKCCIKKIYNTSSPFALWLCNFDENDDEEEEEDDDEGDNNEDDDDDDEEEEIDKELEDKLWSENLAMGDKYSRMMKDAMAFAPNDREGQIAYLSVKSHGTFNGLVRYAIEKEDTMTATRIS